MNRLRNIIENFMRLFGVIESTKAKIAIGYAVASAVAGGGYLTLKDSHPSKAPQVVQTQLASESSVSSPTAKDSTTPFYDAEALRKFIERDRLSQAGRLSRSPEPQNYDNGGAFRGSAADRDEDRTFTPAAPDYRAAYGSYGGAAADGKIDGKDHEDGESSRHPSTESKATTASTETPNGVRPIGSTPADATTSPTSDHRAGILTLHYQFTGPATFVAGACTPFQIGLLDPAERPHVAGASEKYFLTGFAPGAFYSDAACTIAIDPANMEIASGEKLATLYYKNAVTGAVTLAVADKRDHTAGASVNATVLPAPPHHFIVNGPSTYRSGVCTTAYTITAQDEFNNVTPATADTPIALTGAGAGSFYASAGCGGAATPTVTLLSGQSAVQFFVRDNVAQSLTLSADDAGTIIAGTAPLVTGPHHASVATAATIRSGDCGTATLTTKDQAGTTAVTLEDQTFDLTDGATGTFYPASDTTCTGAPMTSVSVLQGTSSTTFRFKSTGGAPISLVASQANAYLASGSAAVNVAPRSLKIMGSAVFGAAVCSSYTIETRAADASLADVLVSTTVNIADGSASGVFYAATDTTCTGATISTVTIAPGATSGAFRYKNNLAEPVTFTAADAASYLLPDSFSALVAPGRLVFVGNNPIRSNDCQLYEIQSQDFLGNTANVPTNVTVNLGDGAAAGVFYAPSDTTCSGSAIATVAIPSGSNNAFLRYRDLTAETATINGDDAAANLVSATLALNVSPDRIKLTGATPIRSGDCEPYTLKFYDTNLIQAAVVRSTTVNLADGAASGDFYSDAACTALITSKVVASGANAATVYYRDPVKQSVTLTATDAATWLTSDSLAIEVGPAKIIITGTTPILSGTCALYTATTKDFNNTTAGVLSNTTVTLLDGTAAGVFYAASDTTCAGAAISSLSFATGTSSVQFRYKDNTAESVTIDGSDGASGMVDASYALVVGPDRLDIAGNSPIRSGDCEAYTITSRDTNLTAAGVLGATTVNLTDDSATGNYYSDAACTALITSTSITSGSNLTTVYYKDPVKENVVLTATDAAASLGADTLNVAVGPYKIIISGTTPALSGTCGVYTATTKDFNNNTAAVLANTTVTLLDGSAAGVFYAAADTTCTGAAISSVSLATGTSSVQFRYKDNTAESVTFDGSDGASGMVDASFALVIGPDRIDIAGNSPIRSGDCEAYTVTTRDTNLTAANVPANVTVNLTDDSPNGNYYSDAACTALINSTVVTSGTNLKTVYYKDPVKENVVLTAADAAAALATDTLNVAVGPYKIMLTGTTPILSGTCQVFTATTKDFNDNAAAVVANTTVTILDGVAAGVFYAAADTTCAGAAISSLSFATGTSAVQFRYKDNTAESLTIDASDGASGMVDASYALVVGPDRIDIAGNSPIRSGDCEAYTLTSRDTNLAAKNVLANTTINLTDDSATGNFYSDAACTALITSAVVTSGTSLKTVYYKDPVKENVVLTATDAAASLATDTLNVAVGPYKIIISGTTPILSGTCQLYTATTKDFNDTASAVLSNTTVTLLDGAAAGVFYAASDTTCAGAAISSLSFTTGTSAVQFRYKDNTAESVTIDGSDGASGMVDASYALVVGPDRIDIAGNSPIRSGGCEAYTLTSRDTNLAAKNVLANTTINLTDDSVNGNYYSDAACTALITSAVVTSGTSLKTVYYKDPVKENVVLTAADAAASLATDTLNVTVGPYKIIISGTTPIRSGTCQLYTVTTKDFNDTAAAVVANTTITLLDGSAAGVFYAAADTTCAGAAIPSLSFTTGTSAVQFRYKDNTAESVTIAGSDGASGMVDASYALSVGPDRVDLAGPSSIRSADCQAFTLTSRDTNLTAANVLVNTVFNMTDTTATGFYYSDSSCLIGATTATITSGTNATTIYYRDTISEFVTLTSTDNAAYLAADTLSLGVGPKLFEITGPDPIRASDCSLYTIKTRDSNGNVAPVLATTTVNLDDGVAAGVFYAATDTTCVGAAIATVSFAAGVDTKTFRYKDLTAQSVTLGADDGAGGLDAGSLPVVIGPSKLTLAGRDAISWSKCEPYVVTARDEAGNAANLLYNTTVNIADGAGSGSFYDVGDSTCAGAAITSKLMPVGTNTVTLYYKNDIQESVTFSADDNAVYLASAAFGVEVGADTLQLTGPTPIRSGECLVYTITTLDATATPQNVQANLTVNLDDGPGVGNFYAVTDTTCAGAAITSAVVSAGTNTKQVRYRNTNAQVVTMTADDGPTGRTAGTLAVTIGPDRLDIAGRNNISIDGCTPYTVTARDTALNGANVISGVLVNLDNGAGSGAFYATADTTCVGAPITTVNIPIATSTVTVYYKNSVSETVTLTSADNSAYLATDSMGVEIGSDRFYIAGPNELRASECGLYSVTMQNNLAAPQNALVDAPVTLTDGVATGNFYAAGDTTCAGATISTATILAGSSSIGFRYKDAKAEAVTLNADDGANGRTGYNYAVTIGPDRLSISGTTPIISGQCSLYTITSRDTGAIAANVLSAVTVNLTDGAAAGEFYAAADTTCAGAAITSTTMALGTSTKTVRYKDNTAESVTLQSADNSTALLSGTFALAVGPSRLKIAGTTPILSGACTAYTITSRDENNTLANVLAATTVNLDDGAAAGDFYGTADTTCAGAPITSIGLASGANTVVVYYKNRKGETANLTVADNATVISSDTLAVVTEASKLLMSGSTTIVAGQCVSYTVRTADDLGTTQNLSSSKIIALDDGAASGDFYASTDTNCTGAVITDVTIASGASTKTFRYKNPVSEAVTLTADDGPGGLTAATRVLAVGPDRLYIAGSASVNYGSCSLLTITTRDAAANTANAAANITVGLSDGAGSGQFYLASDTTCAGAPITTATILNGSSTTTVRYRDNLVESVTLNADDNAANLTSATFALDVIDPCPANLKVQALSAGSPVTTLLAGQKFKVRITAVNGSDVTQTCFAGAKTIAWTMTGGTATAAACGETITTPEAPSETTLTFTNGVAETTAADAAFKVIGAAQVAASDAVHTGNTGALTINAGLTCQIKLRDTAANAGSVVTSKTIDLNVNSATSNDEFDVHAAGYDAFMNFTDDQTVVWSGTGSVYPWASTTTNANDTAKVVGVKIGTGTLQADYAGGGGAKTATVSVTVSTTNSTAAWTTAATDSAGSSLVAANDVQVTQFWKPAADAVTAWRTAGTQTWYSEAFAINARGSRKEFPSQVFLLGSSSALDVVDATNNQVFMRFNRATGRIIDDTLGTITSVSALNGKIYVAMKSGASAGSLIVIDLAQDRADRYDSMGIYAWNGGGLANRNTSSSWTLGSTSQKLAHSAVYSTHALRIGAVDYVLTGTGGGASLLQNNAGTVTIYSSATAGAVTTVGLSTDQKAYFAETGTGLRRADLSLPISANFSVSRTYDRTTSAELPSLTLTDLRVVAGTSSVDAGSNTVVVGSSLGMTSIQEHSTMASSRARTYSYRGSGSTAFGGGLLFDGAAATGSIPFAGAAIGPATGAPVTVELWFRPEATISSGSQVLYQRGTGDTSLKLAIQSGRLEFSYQAVGGAVSKTQSTASSWSRGVWHHAVGIMSSAGLQMWVDGTDYQSLSVDLSAASVASAATVLGSGFYGTIDELRVSKSARYAGATFAVPSAAFTSDANTINLLHFNETEGSTGAYADAGAQRNLTLSGGGWWITPLFSGSSSSVLALDTFTSAGSVTVEVLTGPTSGASSEITGVQNQSGGSLGTSTAGSNATDICIYQADGLTDLDLMIGTSTAGVTLQRR